MLQGKLRHFYCENISTVLRRKVLSLCDSVLDLQRSQFLPIWGQNVKKWRKTEKQQSKQQQRSQQQQLRAAFNLNGLLARKFCRSRSAESLSGTFNELTLNLTTKISTFYLIVYFRTFVKSIDDFMHAKRIVLSCHFWLLFSVDVDAVLRSFYGSVGQAKISINTTVSAESL